MIRDKAVMPRIRSASGDATMTITGKRANYDRVFDLARRGRSGCDRDMGGVVVSAEIIPFMPRTRSRSGSADFPAQSHSAIGPDDLTMDHADTAPCEYLRPCAERGEQSERPWLREHHAKFSW